MDPVGGLKFHPMASILSRTRNILNWSPVAGIQSSALARGLSFSTGSALSPILPPAMVPGSVSAAQALACPPVARGVGLYSSAMLRHEWAAPAPVLAWLTREAEEVSYKIRDVRTLVDLILHNRAMWVVTRDGDGQILDAAHLPTEYWALNAQGYPYLSTEAISLEECIFFSGAMMLPFLEAAKDTLSHYADMTNTMKSRGRNPMPLVELALQEDYDGAEPGDPDYEEKFDAALNAAKSWGVARRAEEGAVAITPRNIKVNMHQPNDDGQMLIAARNAVRLDVGNHLNLNAELLDGDNGSSDTYSNSLQNMGDFQELSLPLFFDALTARLSMDDVTPAGVSVSLVPRFNRTSAQGNVGAAVVGIPQAGQSAGTSINP